MFRDVECLLRPRTIAIVGASDSSRGGWAQEIYSNLEHCGFPAKLYLVNPKRKELWGRPVYPDFASIPERVDLALTIVPSVSIPDTLTEAAAYGLKCALVYAAQFGEGGDPLFGDAGRRVEFGSGAVEGDLRDVAFGLQSGNPVFQRRVRQVGEPLFRQARTGGRDGLARRSALKLSKLRCAREMLPTKSRPIRQDV